MTSHMRTLYNVLVTLLMLFRLVLGMEGCVQYSAYCNNEAAPYYQTCGFQSKNVKCKYTPGDTTIQPIDTIDNTEGSVQILPPRVYIMDENYLNTCLKRAVNITWMLKPNGTYDHIKRFQLQLSSRKKLFDSNDSLVISSHTISELTETKIRYFNVTLLSNDTSKMVFFYECFMVDPGTTYTIQITTLPSRTGQDKDTSQLSFTTTDKFNNHKYDRPDINNTGLWVAISWVSMNPSWGSLMVCFTLAPSSYGFTSYLIELVDDSTGSLNIVRYRDIVPASDSNGDGKICRNFPSVCAGVYRAYVSAVNDGGCRCKENSKCKNCARSQISGLNFNSAIVCPRHVTSEVGKFVAAGLGTTLALILILLLAFILYRKKNKSGGFQFKGGSSGSLRDTSCTIGHDRKLTIMIVYSCDNEPHRAVVCRFAAFLQSQCYCNVIIDEWPESRAAITQLGMAQWLTKQFDRATHVLLIHSTGARRRLEGRIEGVRYECLEDVMLDLFVPSVTLLQDNFLHCTRRKKVFEVYFPYSFDDVADLKLTGGLGGKTGNKPYSMMNKIDELFLNIHNLTKYNAKGKAGLSLINAEEYSTCKEGELLKETIEEAVVFHQKNKNWFDDTHRKIVDGEEEEYRSRHSSVESTTTMLENETETSGDFRKRQTSANEKTQKIFQRLGSISSGTSDDYGYNKKILPPRCDTGARKLLKRSDGDASTINDPTELSLSESKFDSGLGSLRFEPPAEFYSPRNARLSRSLSKLSLDKIRQRSSLASSSDESDFVCIPPDDMNDSSSFDSSQYENFAKIMNDSISMGNISLDKNIAVISHPGAKTIVKINEINNNIDKEKPGSRLSHHPLMAL